MCDLTQKLGSPEGLFRSELADKKKVICDVCFLADFWPKSTVKQVIYFVCDMQNSPIIFVREFDLNRP